MKINRPPLSLLHIPFNSARIAGIVLLTAGVLIALDQFLETGWLFLIILPIIGIILLMDGILTKSLGFVISGSLVSGVGFGTLLAFYVMVGKSWPTRIGLLLGTVAIGWFAITGFSAILIHKNTGWALIPGAVFASVSTCFLFTSMQLVDFVFFIGLGLGICLLIWGATSRLIGLIIPGCILAGIAPGIYHAWRIIPVKNALSQTGLMLVWFALGWGLITVFSKVINEKFIWWPLIPAGILVMVGCGLYIGGKPENAVTFIGNTGSVGLIIFGLYLLLLRRGIRG